MTANDAVVRLASGKFGVLFILRTIDRRKVLCLCSSCQHSISVSLADLQVGDVVCPYCADCARLWRKDVHKKAAATAAGSER